MPHGDRHSADDILIISLASGQTIPVAAKLADVSESTVARRLRSSRFRRRLQRMRTRVIETALGRLAGNMTAAADRLRVLVDDPDPRVALGAARSILALAGGLSRAVDERQGIEAIEDALGDLKARNPGLFDREPHGETND